MVPNANGSFSKNPAGPFQRTHPAWTMWSLICIQVCKPMSNKGPGAGNCSMGRSTRLPSISAATSIGNSKRSSCLFRSEWAKSHVESKASPSSFRRKFSLPSPISNPLAHNIRLPTAPTGMMVSATPRSQRLLAMSRLSSHLTPPRIAV